jgi:hypothetical protein
MFRVEGYIVVYIGRKCFVKIDNAEEEEEHGASEGYFGTKLMTRSDGKMKVYKPCFTDIFVET